MFEQLFPIHPKLVHFPIALFCAALILDILSRFFRKQNLHEATVAIYVMAALFTPMVVWAGLWEQQRLHLHHPVLEQHKLYGFITMWSSILSLPVLWCLGKRSLKIFRIVFTCLLIGLTILVITTGFLGGRMVYEYGAGVQS
jgi:uncharacterized membrane protein